MGLFEVLPMSDSCRALVAERADANRIREVAIREGMATLRQDALSKARQGLTSLEEVLRETAT
ncbi:MAG: hypothetical protein IPN71_13720 [Fibrobacteres bacterium]|nr:hypothetical protein [Fibrobacterota bacterium]